MLYNLYYTDPDTGQERWAAVVDEFTALSLATESTAWRAVGTIE